MNETRQRHGCLTTWLVLMIVANSLTALLYTFGSAAILQNLPDAPAWALPVLGVACVINVVFAVALLQWKKWGFFGFTAMAIVTLFINLAIGLEVAQALPGLLGIAVLYWVLQMGQENKGWTQLE